MRNSLKYELNKACLDGASLSEQTVSNYKAYNAHFRDYCISNGYNSIEKVRAGGVALLSDYASYLDAQGKSAATIHSYLSAPCRALDINMAEVDKPRRVTAEGTKSTGHSSDRSERERVLERYAGAYDFVRAVGIREHEAKRLTGDCLVRDDYGNLCVAVEHGKGGKSQLQVVLPQYESAVTDAFRGVPADAKVFASIQWSKNINYHGARAELAREAYDYYKSVLADPDARATMRGQLIDRYDTACRQLRDDGKISDAQYRHKIDAFVGRVSDDTAYRLRGANLTSAIEHGRPVEYDRLAVMAVSVLHLSHWRSDVTISNYLLK